MTETLTGKQVLALLAQDEVPEIAVLTEEGWRTFQPHHWHLNSVLAAGYEFRIKPTPPRRLSVTLANGDVVSWPEPVRGALKDGQEYWYFDALGLVNRLTWDGGSCDLKTLAFGNVHLTREAAQEHADALRKINTQEVSDVA